MLNLNHTNKDRQYFDINETAELLGKTAPQVRQLLKHQDLNANKLGGQWWITRDSIEKYISEQA